uniref:Uncharacterized protein n=1 Tax=Trypanosoma congolense (strain IL3000) TaxID=1068625 RepID=G0UWY3_TRYCI|nr:conserved hypothetical protein [Trypanosoma congolense IL3000]
MATAKALTCVSKREVLDLVKAALEQHVQSGVIDREDFKKLAKKSADTLEPPVTANEVRKITLQELLAFLSEGEAEEAVVAPVRAEIEALKSLLNVPQECGTTAQAPVFSLSALRERITRRKEELRRKRQGAQTVGDETPRHECCPQPNDVPHAPELAEDGKSESAVNHDEPQRHRQRTEAAATAAAPKEVDLYAGLVAAHAAVW